MAASAHRCPTCRQAYAGNGRASSDWPHFPFCSDRCQMVDLNKWFNEEYRVSQSLDPAIDDEALERADRPHDPRNEP